MIVKLPVELEPEDPPELRLPVPVQPVVSYWVLDPPLTGLVTVEDTEDPLLYQFCPVGLS